MTSRSSNAPLSREFYDRDVAEVARALLGCELRVRSPEGETRGVIVETEAYRGVHDPASHAVAGRTPRTWHLFGPPGTIYVYRSYGIHWCANIVTADEGDGSAVLLRAVEPTAGLPLMYARRRAATRETQLASGPGKLCEAFGITRDLHDGQAAMRGAMTVHAGRAVDGVGVSARVGITKAVEWPLRFFVIGNAHVSRFRSGGRGRG